MATPQGVDAAAATADAPSAVTRSTRASAAAPL